MPLRVITRADTGTLWITGTVRPAGAAQGYRVRQRAGTDDEALAREEAAAIEREIIRNHHLGQRPIERGFAAAATAYCQAEKRPTATPLRLKRLLRHFGNAPLRSITQDAMDTARTALWPNGAAAGTIRRELYVPVSAVLHFSARRGWCDEPRFDPPAETRGRTAFLLPAQADALMAELPDRLRPLVRFLLCTGCRLGEALALQWDQVDLQAARARLWADQTKARRSGVVMLPPAAVMALAGLPGARAGHVFRSRYRGAGGEALPYRQTEAGGGGQIHNAFGAAAERAGVPWATPHVCRHTFASWHYALHRDLLALKEAGRWASVELVERYAHLMPSGQEDAIRRWWGLGELVVVEAKRA